MLQKLVELYDRLAEDPESGINPPGYVNHPVCFCVVINSDGKLLNIEDLRDQRKKGQLFSLPGNTKPSGSKVNPSLHGWDTNQYMLGVTSLDPKDGKKTLQRTKICHQAYKTKICSMEGDINNPIYSSFCRFLERLDPKEMRKYPFLFELNKGYGIVKVQGHEGYLHEIPELQEAEEEVGPGYIDRCLVTGELTRIARIHPVKIRGFKESQALISVNLPQANSWGHTQSYNSPVSETVTFKYATALNYISEVMGNRLAIGDTTYIFWSEAPSDLPGILRSIFEQSIMDSLRSLKEGVVDDEIDKLASERIPFFILGLSLKAGRFIIRDWVESTTGEIFKMVLKHQEDLEITKSKGDKEFLPLWELLVQTVPDPGLLSPSLEREFSRSVFHGTNYPSSILPQVLSRIKADGSTRHSRMALVKAVLTRNYGKKELFMLDPERPEVGYQLGRLFAILEKAQRDAIPHINSTIKDKYFRTACATPAMVFPRMIGTVQHHVGKIRRRKPAFGISTEKKIQDVLKQVDRIPIRLSLEEQGLFALGYYHQERDIFTPKTEKEPNVSVIEAVL